MVGVGRLGEAVAGVVVSVEREHARDRQPLAELLRDAQVRVDLAAPLVGITRGSELGYGVEPSAREGAQLAVGIHRGDVGGLGEVGRFEDRGLRRSGVVGIGQVSLDAQLDLGGAERIEGQVGRDVVPAVVGIRVVVGQLRVLVHAVLVVIGQSDVVYGLVRSSRHIDVRRTVVAVVAQDLVHPVHIGVEIGVGMRAGLFDHFAAVERTAAARCRGFVRHLHVSGAIDEVGDLRRGRDAFGVAYGELRTPFQTALGVDDDDAVRSAHAVDGRGRSILEDRETLDILRIDVGERAGHAVHERQRCAHAGRQGRDAADVDVRIVESRLAGPLYGDQTGDTAGESLREVGGRHLEFIDLDALLRADDADLFLYAVSDHLHGIEQGVVLFEHDVEQAASGDGHILGLVTHVAEFQYVVGQYVDQVVSVDVGSRADVGPLLHEYRHADQGFAAVVLDRTHDAQRGLLLGFTRCCGLADDDLPSGEFPGVLRSGEEHFEHIPDGLVRDADRHAARGVEDVVVVDENIVALVFDAREYLLERDILQVERDACIRGGRLCGDRAEQPDCGQQKQDFYP